MKIKYGDIPQGFTQAFPKEEKPPELVEGKYYFLFIPAHSAGSGELFFTIRDGRAIAVQ